MTRNRISMVVAAAGLVLVGLLAAALFSPGNEATEDQTAKSDEVTVLTPKPVEMKNPLDIALDVPPVNQQPAEPAPDTLIPTPTPPTTPKPEVKKPEPVAPAEKPSGVIDYKIQSGDMVSKLAVKYGCKASDIYRLNDGLDSSNAHRLRVGQSIRIPVGGEGAASVEQAGPAPSEGQWYARRVVTAEAGDTLFSLALDHYGARHLFRKIRDANPNIQWEHRLRGGEQVVLPEHGTAPAGTPRTPSDTVERSSLIPSRR